MIFLYKCSYLLTQSINSIRKNFTQKALLALFIGILSQHAMAEKINFNTADSATLQSIPGIGENKARSIIEYREQIGGFTSNQQLMEVSGIGESVLKQIIQYGDIKPTKDSNSKQTDTQG